MDFKEKMDIAVREGECFGCSVDIYKECKDTREIMKRLSQALNHYTSEDSRFAKYGYMYEIFEEALSRTASIILKKIEDDFNLDENEVFESTADLYLKSSALDNDFKGEFYE